MPVRMEEGNWRVHVDGRRGGGAPRHGQTTQKQKKQHAKIPPPSSPPSASFNGWREQPPLFRRLCISLPSPCCSSPSPNHHPFCWGQLTHPTLSISPFPFFRFGCCFCLFSPNAFSVGGFANAQGRVATIHETAKAIGGCCLISGKFCNGNPEERGIWI
jgi:hypothetical protein